jgi:hypothetical protein
MSESARQAVTLGLSRTGTFEPDSTVAAHISGRSAADALRALAAQRLLREAATLLPSLAAAEVAPVETQPLARQSASTLLQIIFATESWLVDEALDVLHERGLRLPHAALLAVLSSTDATLRGRIARVAGTRGRWLAQTLNAYQWLLQIAQTQDVVALKQTFLEGGLVEREAALREWRGIDPLAARTALMVNFAQDKADARVRLLGAMAINLSLDDEAWLASLLSDRAATVQSAARMLLLKLPDSQLRQRNLALLQQCLSLRAGSLQISLPESWTPAQQLDGLLPVPKDHASPKAFMLRALASVTRASDWLAISALTPAQFVSALRAHAFFLDILSAWMEAGVDLSALSEELVLALHAENTASAAAKQSYQMKLERLNLQKHLLAYLPEVAWEKLWPQLHSDAQLRDALYAKLPRPWPASITQHWLRWLRESLHTASELHATATKSDTPSSTLFMLRYTLSDALNAARNGLAAPQFALAQSLQVSDLHPFFDLIQQFQRALELRARIHSEFYS